MVKERCLDIVLATCNGEEFVAEQLSSLQHCDDYTKFVSRVLVVDDCSDDNTVDIVAAFVKNDSRIFWFPSDTERQGTIRNFERGSILTDAPYVMFCDQDDVWHRDKITLQLNCIKIQEEKYGIDFPLLVFSDLEVVDECLRCINPSFFKYQNISPEWSTSFNQLLIQNVAAGCTILINRPLLLKALPLPSAIIMHDWWLMLVARAFGQIFWLEKSLVKYRQHGANQVGAKKITWRWLLSLVHRCRGGVANLKHQGTQAQVFIERYGNDSTSMLGEKDGVALTQLSQLPVSTLQKRLRYFMSGNLRKNDFFRNVGLLLVLVLWLDVKDR